MRRPRGADDATAGPRRARADRPRQLPRRPGHDVAHTPRHPTRRRRARPHTTRGVTSRGRRHGRDDPRSGHVQSRSCNAAPPTSALGFCHRDYHPGNVLWSRGQVSGVVDWTHACHGAPAVDVAHCALNLARLVRHRRRRRVRAPLRARARAFAWFAAADAVSWGDSEPALWRWHDAGRTDITRAGAHRCRRRVPRRAPCVDAPRGSRQS